MSEEKFNPVYEISAQEYNLKLADALKEIPEFKEPEWAQFVKSGSSKARPINDLNFWHKRAASILRQIYKKGIVGVNRLRTKYGSRKNRGMRPEQFRKSSGKIIRTILQQADAVGFTEIAKTIKGIRSKRPGRQLTQKGRSFLEGIK
ncbi:MAG: small subunit ribosomal protein S19e [archaeon GW2011_AR19]|nr:MAG: small subunit ribosomal protein S19e [archaeon GW2011_AR19]